MNGQPKDHFWVPDEEVQRIDKKLTARPKPKNIPFAEHGVKLSHGLQTVEETSERSATDNSLSDLDMLVFNVKLQEDERIQDNKDLFNANGMHIRAVKNVRSAIVTSTNSQFQRLKKRVASYASSGENPKLDHVESFSPYTGSEKNSSELRKTMSLETHPQTLDVQLMLIPNLESDAYNSALNKLTEKRPTGNHSLIPELDSSRPILKL